MGKDIKIYKNHNTDAKTNQDRIKKNIYSIMKAPSSRRITVPFQLLLFFFCGCLCFFNNLLSYVVGSNLVVVKIN